MLLIFDLDGTLFQAKTVYLNADLRLLHEMGLPVPDDGTLLKYAGSGSLDVFLKAVLPDGADISAARSRYLDLINEEIRENGELFPGVSEMVRRLARDGHELVVCSKSPIEYIRSALEYTGILPLFSQYHSSEFCSKAELIGSLVKRGAAAAVIGDTHKDVEAAQENGLPAIAAAYGYGNKAMLSAADYIANTPEEIVNYIEKRWDNYEI